MFICNCFMVGNVGADPVVRMRPDGKTVTTVSLAVDERVIRDGQSVFETSWYRLYAYGATGERLARVGKGDRLFVVGTVRLVNQDDKMAYYITANRFTVLKSGSSTVAKRERAELNNELEKLADAVDGGDDIDEFPF